MSNEAFRMGDVGGIEHGLTPSEHGRGIPETDHRRRQQSQSRVAVLVVVPRKEDVAENAGVFDGTEAVGDSGRYFSVRNWLSECGSSSRTYGRLWVLVTPRSASRKATGFDRMTRPRSACSVSSPGGIWCFSSVSAMKASANSAPSRWAIIQPTTYRLKTSRIT
jgi:hypothetical protein